MNAPCNEASLLRRRLTPPVRHLVDAVASLANAKGLRVAVVGGLVRDFLLGQDITAITDVDFVVEGDALSFAHALNKTLGGKIRRHEPFLTASIAFTSSDGQKLNADFATARTECYPSPASLPQVRPSTLAEDMARRDFTINAMAIRLDDRTREALLDLVGGKKDLEQRILRTLHTASFRDDPTRMLRAARYAVRCGLELDPYTAGDMQQHLGSLDVLSNARLRHECERISLEEHPAEIWLKLAQWHVLQAFHTALRAYSPQPERLSLLERELEWLALHLPEAMPDRFLVMLIGIVENMSDAQVCDVTKRLALTPQQGRNLLEIHRRASAMHHALETLFQTTGSIRPSRCHRLLEHYPLEGILALRAGASEAVRTALERELLVTRRIAPFLSGADLLALGVPPGPRIGMLLKKMKQRAIDGLDKTREDAMEFLKHSLLFPDTP